MRRSGLAIALVSGFLVLPAACSSSSSGGKDAGGGSGGHAGSSGGSGGGTGGSTGGSGGQTGGSGGGQTDGGGGTGGTTTDGGSDAPADGAGGSADGGSSDGGTMSRGEYLVKNVLGCSGCHTPSTNGAPDMTKFLSGIDCFAKSGTDCLSSANLTNDDTGLKKFTDQQIKDAFTKGMDPDPASAGKFLFSNMPYYQFANLSDADATAIVAYLRTVPAVAHEPAANTGVFATQPSAADWTAVNPADLPAAGAGAGAANGKYLATLACVTCHTVNVTGPPTHIDATKAFQGGKVVTAGANMVQTSNLTPDATGIMGWTAANIMTAIKTAKNKDGVAICGMRALANMTDTDATDIGTYLLGIPAVANAITMKCP